MGVTVLMVARWHCAGCGRFATTTYKPTGHRRWVGTSLRTCGPYEELTEPRRIEVTL